MGKVVSAGGLHMPSTTTLASPQHADWTQHGTIATQLQALCNAFLRPHIQGIQSETLQPQNKHTHTHTHGGFSWCFSWPKTGWMAHVMLHNYRMWTYKQLWSMSAAFSPALGCLGVGEPGRRLLRKGALRLSPLS